MSDQPKEALPEQSDSQLPYGPLAWELAQHASFERTDGGGIRARCELHVGGRVDGLGATHDAAIRDLAVNLGWWAKGYQS